MKKIVVFFLFTAFYVKAQETIYSEKSRGRVFINNSLLSPQEVRDEFSVNLEALNLYNQGRNKKTWGNVLIYTSGFALGGVIGTIASEGDRSQLATFGGLAVISAGIGIPVKIGYRKKIKESVQLMNDFKNNQNKPQSSTLKSEIIASVDGVGLKISF